MVTPDFGIANIKEFFSALDTHELAAGFQRMAKSDSNKITFKGSKFHHALTIRFTPEIHAKWKKSMVELGETNAGSINAEVSKRASGEFAAAFKDGQILIEVKQDGKRFAFASEQTAADIRDGKLQLLKNGKQEKYDNISVVNHDDFVVIANTLITHVQSEIEPAAVLSKEVIAATKETAPQQPQQQAPTQTAVQTAKKTTQAPLKKPKMAEDVEERELERREERELEHEHDMLHEKQTEERKRERLEDKIEHSEINEESVKEEAIAEETTSQDSSFQDQGSSVPS